MNRKIIASALILSALMNCSCARSQEISYPPEVREVFNEADEAATPLVGFRPMIGLPKALADRSEEIIGLGGIPVVISAGLDSEQYAAWCSVLDGLLLGDGFVTASDKGSLLLFKAAADRNLPVMGSNKLMDKINAGLYRRKENPASAGDLVKAASLYHQARELHKRMFTLDTHSDLPYLYRRGFRLGRRAVNQVSIRKMDEGGLDATFLICYLGQKDKGSEAEAARWCLGRLEEIRADVNGNSAHAALATTPEQARLAKAEGKKAFFIGIENGFCIGNDLKNIEKYANLGVRYITLSHTSDNKICHSSSHSADTTLGLTAFGEQVVREMNRCGVLVDCSHVSAGTLRDCIRLSKAPVICSHSGCRALYDHDRNLTDSQLRAVAGSGGVVQIYAVRGFQSRGQASIGTLLDHIDHAVEVAGIDHVGIGLDLDGGGGYAGICGANDAINITIGLLERGYSGSDIAKIWSGNFFRVMDQAARIAEELR